MYTRLSAGRLDAPDDADPSDDDAVNTDEKIWDLTQAINVKGVWYGCKYAVIAMRNVSGRQSGRSGRAR